VVKKTDKTRKTRKIRIENALTGREKKPRYMGWPIATMGGCAVYRDHPESKARRFSLSRSNAHLRNRRNVVPVARECFVGIFFGKVDRHFAVVVMSNYKKSLPLLIGDSVPSLSCRHGTNMLLLHSESARIFEHKLNHLVKINKQKDQLCFGSLKARVDSLNSPSSLQILGVNVSSFFFF
jgi:hypothetical protein